MRKLSFAAAIAVPSLVTIAALAQSAPKPSPVVVSVVGHGEILVLVSDGSTKPCDSSDDRLLFKGPVKAGEHINAVSTTGAVCVDHTYGEFRQSQWAGPSIWFAGSLSPFGPAPSHVELEGTVSTDEP
ncbi:MAG: hypothetical protein ACLP1X_32300 [Polyangiaceae bacterium]|jgi:hypothetical protein